MALLLIWYIYIYIYIGLQSFVDDFIDPYSRIQHCSNSINTKDTKMAHTDIHSKDIEKQEDQHIQSVLYFF